MMVNINWPIDNAFSRLRPTRLLMFKNYIKVAIRNLSKHKLFSFINIFGLALSMSVCLIVLIRVKDQMGYDKFHPRHDDILRIITRVTDRQGSEYKLATTPLPLANILTKEYDFVEHSLRIYPLGTRAASSSSRELQITAAFVDVGFFHVFGFDLLLGNKTSALARPNTIVLSTETAARYFGQDDPLGKTLFFESLGEFEVTGVLDRPKGKSHINFEGLISMNSVAVLERSGKLQANSESWNNGTSAYTYLTLKSNSSARSLSKAVSQISSELMKNTRKVGKEGFAFAVQPFDDIILGEDLGYNLGNTGSPEKVIAEIVISFILLLSACFNYTNLSLARSLERGKEVGVRKVAGAFRIQIFYQFVIESVFIALLSLGGALLLYVLITDYAPFASELLPANVVIDAKLITWFLIFTIFTGLLAGSLPAWALSSFRPVEVLKNLSNIKLFGSKGLRKTLIVIQFALSLIIIVFTLTFYNQFKYMANGDAGYDVRNIVNIPLAGSDYKLLSNQISNLKGVEQTSATSVNLGRSAAGSALLQLEKGTDPISMEFYDVDENFVKNMRLTLLAGSTFFQQDATEKSIIISDLARKILQFPSPDAAVGQTVWINDTLQVTIAGVMRDFFYRGLETPYGPLFLRNRPAEFKFMHVRTLASEDKTVLAAVRNVLKQHYPLKQFQPVWLYEEIHGRKSAWGVVSMLGFLTLITITLACMGLLGMVVYNTETRRKEIGIRKVMGASIPAIMMLLSRNFVKLVLIAGLIALPVSYLLSYFFLNAFANRINIGVGLLSVSFLGMVFISLITIGSQIYRVAMANPVKALRTE